MELVRARVIHDSCSACRSALLEEAKSLGGLALAGEIVMIPEHWLSHRCPHGLSGLIFERTEIEKSAIPNQGERAKSDEIEMESGDSKMDASKNGGYPSREQGRYGSHPMHDDFDDESDPDGSGNY